MDGEGQERTGPPGTEAKGKATPKAGSSECAQKKQAWTSQVTGGLERQVGGPKAPEFTGGSGRREQRDEDRSANNLICPTVGMQGRTQGEKEELRGLAFGEGKGDGGVREDFPLSSPLRDV